MINRQYFFAAKRYTVELVCDAILNSILYNIFSFSLSNTFKALEVIIMFSRQNFVHTFFLRKSSLLKISRVTV